MIDRFFSLSPATNVLFLVLVCSLLHSWQNSIFAQVSQDDSLALVTMYNRLGGPNWFNQTNWLQHPVGSWAGIGVTNGRVDSLNLSFNNLRGAIPSALYDLTHLHSLALGENQITGIISEKIGQLKNLQYLLLFGNELTGPIPPEIAELQELRLLALAANEFNGELPVELGSLTKLENLDLFANNFSGSIPEEIALLTNLSRLFLTRNQLSGSIPPQLGSLTNLEVVRIERNQFTGELPPELGGLENLRILDLSENRLRGALPPEWGALKNLQVLWLYDNQLTGEIPEAWADMESLITLQILNNPLSGRLPIALTRLEALTHLNIRNTNICVPQDEVLRFWLSGLASFLSSEINCVATSNARDDGLPKALTLGASYPNPASTQATFRVGLPVHTRVTLTVYDLLGRAIARMHESTLPAGWHAIELDLSTLPTDSYIVTLQAGASAISRPIIVIK